MYQDGVVSAASRRDFLAAVAASATVASAGCIDGEPAEETYYVATFHWGFATFDEDGEEVEEIRVEEGAEVTLYAVNDHAYDAIEGLPDAVAESVSELDALERTKERVEAGEIPEPEDSTIEEEYDAVHAVLHDIEDDHEHGDDGYGDDDHHDDDGHHDDEHDGNDHGHDEEDGHNDDEDHHDDHAHDDHGYDETVLDHFVVIDEFDVSTESSAQFQEPRSETFVADETGSFDVYCPHPCGYGHAWMRQEMFHVE